MTWSGKLIDQWVWAKREFRSQHSREQLIKRIEQGANGWGWKAPLAYQLKENRLRLRFMGVPRKGHARNIRRDFYGKILALDEGAVIAGVFRWPTYCWVFLTGWFLFMAIFSMEEHRYAGFLLCLPLVLFGFVVQMSQDEPYHEVMEDFLTRITADP
jgi:hypothetical protein